MSSFKRKNNFYSLALIFVFSSQLISTSSFARDEYSTALNSVIDGSYTDLASLSPHVNLKYVEESIRIKSAKQPTATTHHINGEYFAALDNVIDTPRSNQVRQNQQQKSKNKEYLPAKGYVYMDKEIKDEFEANLFKTTVLNFESYLDLERKDQQEVIAIYSASDNMETAIMKLQELSDKY